MDVSSHLIHRVNVGDLVTRSAERFPEREMICDRDRRWSYRDFDAGPIGSPMVFPRSVSRKATHLP